MMTSSSSCGCSCHAGPFHTCDVPGGCGSTGCGRNEPAPGNCPGCRLRDPNYALICDPCWSWLPSALAGISDMYQRLPDVLEPATITVEKVTGSTDPAAPLNVDAEDLLTRVVRDGGIPHDTTRDTPIPATALVPVTVSVTTFAAGTYHTRNETRIERRILTDDHGQALYRPGRDQVGYLPVAQVLDAWVRDWIHERGQHEHRPPTDAPTLISWLGNRIDWAATHYAAIGDFMQSLRTVRGNMMNVLGEFDPPPQSCDGVQCAGCDKRILFRAPDGSGDVLCRNPDCQKVYRPADFTDLVKRQSDTERAKRDAKEIREALLRREPANIS